MEGIVPARPWPASAAVRIKAPYLSTPTYLPPGRISFYDVPQHHGLASTAEAVALIRKFDTIRSLSSFMQSWLFFELLSAFLGFPVDPLDFVTDGHINLDQDTAHGHFRRWKERLWRQSFTKKRMAQHKMASKIQFALQRSDVFEEAADLLEPQEEDFDLVALSIKLLVSLLTTVLGDTFSLSSGLWAPWAHGAYKKAKRLVILSRPMNNFASTYGSEFLAERQELKSLHDQQRVFLPLPPGEQDGGRAAARLVRLLEENGWCPFRARQLCKNYDYLAINSLASLVHHRDTTEDHGSCVELGRCAAHDLETDPTVPYPFRHQCNGGCDFIHIAYDDVAGILRQGGIPIVSVSIEGPLDLKVVRCTPSMTYTAISHVWSDGLGNPDTNALPSCQLLKLRDQIRQSYLPESSPFYGSDDTMSSLTSRVQWQIAAQVYRARPYLSFDRKRIFFWMDTLCIPVSSQPEFIGESKELRFQAIKQITPIFAGAYNVLVLDRGLQDTTGFVPNELCGDDFASLVLGSKWMERGWTLEEGCLAQSCVFQLMGKPYEMSTSQKNLLPRTEKHHSPLERAFIQSRHSTVSLMKKALLDTKKHVWIDPLASRANRLSKFLRIPQFVWTWNSLIDRSTTKPQDGIIILANLLDFNVYALRHIPKEQRLMSVVQSCDELPLSLLYNTGPRACIEGHPELGWIPKDVAGDSLVVGGAIRRIRPRRADGHVAFVIERPKDKKRDPLLVLSNGEHIPREASVFVVRNHNRGDNDVAHREFVIEIQPTGLPTEDEMSGRIVEDSDLQPLGSCIVVDLACGTAQSRGFVGRGVRFSIHHRDRKHMVLKYDAPLVAWTREQWLRRTREPPIPDLVYEMDSVPPRQKLLLTYDKSLWCKPLSRRSLFTQHPPEAQIIGMIVFLVVLLLVVIGLGWLFVTVRDALGFAQRPFPIGAILVSILGPVFAAYVYDPIRRRLAMFRYVTWIKSFEETNTEPRVGRWSALGRSLARLFMRLGRRGQRGVTHININLAFRSRGGDADDDELPSEIYLD